MNERVIVIHHQLSYKHSLLSNEYWPGPAPPTSSLIRLVFLLHTKAFVEGLKVGSERTCWEL